jgi:hypothetical protein
VTDLNPQAKMSLVIECVRAAAPAGSADPKDVRVRAVADDAALALSFLVTSLALCGLVIQRLRKAVSCCCHRTLKTGHQGTIQNRPL